MLLALFYINEAASTIDKNNDALLDVVFEHIRLRNWARTEVQEIRPDREDSNTVLTVMDFIL